MGSDWFPLSFATSIGPHIHPAGNNCGTISGYLVCKLSYDASLVTLTIPTSHIPGAYSALLIRAKLHVLV